MKNSLVALTLVFTSFLAISTVSSAGIVAKVKVTERHFTGKDSVADPKPEPALFKQIGRTDDRGTFALRERFIASQPSMRGIYGEGKGVTGFMGGGKGVVGKDPFNPKEYRFVDHHVDWKFYHEEGKGKMGQMGGGRGTVPAAAAPAKFLFNS